MINRVLGRNGQTESESKYHKIFINLAAGVKGEKEREVVYAAGAYPQKTESGIFHSD